MRNRLILVLLCAHFDVAHASAVSDDRLLLAGGALPICSSSAPRACSGASPTATDTEVVAFEQSRSDAARAIFSHFVAMARGAAKTRTGNAPERPRIAVLTASSVNPFDAVAFYLAVFEQAGADAVWLPLDGAVRASFGRCQNIGTARVALTGLADSSAQFPALAADQRTFCERRAALKEHIDQADALFFNGGDQTLTKAAWFNGVEPIAEWREVERRVATGTLAIGGTSAGTAVMSARVMIGNGDSATALKRGAKPGPPPPIGCAKRNDCPPGLLEDDLTYDPNGGLGLFSLGVLDTHFAARDRQGRLARLLIDSGERFGFGVDETTALLVAPTAKTVRLRVLGAGAVWIYDATRARDARALKDRARLLKPGTTLEWPHP
jgi:cyanophycinase